MNGNDLRARFDILIISRLFSAPDASLLFAYNHLLCYDLPGLKNISLSHYVPVSLNLVLSLVFLYPSLSGLVKHYQLHPTKYS